MNSSEALLAGICVFSQTQCHDKMRASEIFWRVGTKDSRDAVGHPPLNFAANDFLYVPFTSTALDSTGPLLQSKYFVCIICLSAYLYSWMHCKEMRRLFPTITKDCPYIRDEIELLSVLLSFYHHLNLLQYDPGPPDKMGKKTACLPMDLSSHDASRRKSFTSCFSSQDQPC